jgi:hypothetical protein
MSEGVSAAAKCSKVGQVRGTRVCRKVGKDLVWVAAPVAKTTTTTVGVSGSGGAGGSVATTTTVAASGSGGAGGSVATTTTTTTVATTTTTTTVGASGSGGAGGSVATTTTVAKSYTALTIGTKYSYTSAAVGQPFYCMALKGAHETKYGDWISGNVWYPARKPYWPSTTKITNGSFGAAVSGSNRILTGNGLPIGLGATVGNYPFNSSNELYSKYDPNSGSLSAYTISKTVPATPTVNASPRCLPGGMLGITTTGVAFYGANDAVMRDAAAYEILDSCGGHPVATTGSYHYHSLFLAEYGLAYGNVWSCIDLGSAGAHGNLIGYANDGFGIYGPYGATGAMLYTADLDVCHGDTHSITWDGATVSMYHYHATVDYPYTLSCFRGTPK